ncbi:hypothetical protein CcaCcLH18_14269 [Colletotrichum camelliae]|nr:hypothetical protein CcaCcLH18_14269 [Colletotrichum camelliae]
MRLTRLLKKFNSSKDGPAVATSTPQPEAPCAPQVRPFGLEVLVEGTDPVVDIVAVHGLNGHREHTWTASGGKHWLRDFLPTDLPNARVLCWGYDANTHSNSGVSIQYLYDHARELVTDLTIKRGLTKSRERPIIFVAHSLGGIVVKSALIHSDAAREDALVEHRAIKTSTHGILFMGTPHQGGNGVQLGRVLVNVASIFVSADDHLLKHLERDSEWLQQQLGQFGPISREFVTKFAYEGYPTSSPLGKIMVVPRASAVVPGQPDGEPIVIHADHINMVKFASREDPSYEKVSGMLQIMVENAPIDIRSRWELEKRGAQARHSGRHLQRVSDADSAVYCHEQEHDPKYENDRRNTCLQAFKTSNYEKFKNNNRERVPGTCKWVLEHLKYRKWRESSQDDLLWISADPGCGKSVLAKSLVDEELQRTEEHTVCYFFFKDNDEQNDLSTALCAVLHQLFCSKPLLLPHALDPYEKIGERLQIEAEEMWRILLAATADEHANAVTCVLDALDECRKDDQRHLVKLLTTFYTRAETESTRRSRLKILVTSRPYRDIEHGFKDIPSTLPSIRLAGEKNTAKMTEEINLFVKQEVSKAGRILQLDQEMQRTLQKKLLATSHRTYLWLHLVMRELYLSDKTTKKGLMAVIEKLPKTVTEAYEDVLRRLNNNQRQKAQTILHIVVGARRPLTLQEMDVAIQLATDSADSREHNELDLDLDRLEERIRQLCGLFVYVDNSRVYLIHQTAKEFLLGNEQQASSSYSSWQHSLNERYSNTMLTRICTQYLFFRDFDNHGVDPVRRAQRGSEDHPFLNYAAVHWPSHFSHAEIDQDILMSRLVDLYNDRTPRFATWSSIYWRAVNRGQEIPGLKGIHLLAFNGHNQLLSRFLGLNHEGVDIRAENGSTALAFASRNGHMEMVRLLLEKGADMNAVDNEGQTPMYVASYYGHLDVLQHLIKRGADKDIPNKDSWTPLYTASRNGHLEVVRLLVQNGADLIAAANTGRTPLYETAHHGYLKVFQLLLESGASAHSADKVGWTPLHGAPSSYSSNAYISSTPPKSPNTSLPRDAAGAKAARTTKTMPTKPIPTDSKIWILVQKGYCLRWLWHVHGDGLYGLVPQARPASGDAAARKTALTPTQRVVTTLLAMLPLAIQHVFLGNLFASVKLFRALRGQNIGATGTCRRDAGIDILVAEKEDDGKGIPWGTVHVIHTVNGQYGLINGDFVTKFAYEVSKTPTPFGKITDAIKQLEHVVDVRKTTLDEGHTSRLASQHELARAYQADGRVKDAIELLEHVIDVRAYQAAEAANEILNEAF